MENQLEGQLDYIFSNITNELISATKKHGKFHSEHEGIAIIREEFEELWEIIKNKQNTGIREKEMFVESVQIAAMAIRFIIDNCSNIIKDNIKVKKFQAQYKDVAKMIKN